MPRAAGSRLSPWIETVVLGYSQEGGGGGGGGGQLKAHVLGVGEMSQSQAQSSEGPTGLLFLSDGVLQIPAVLTASAWELLQEQEDRECFTSLVNATVCIQDYRLHFHMAPEQTKCRFFLSVGELATTAAGPVKDSTPCCTTLPSVRQKIHQTWRALLGQDLQESQQSRSGLELSLLLGEWQHDCVQTVLEDVRGRLGTGPPPAGHASPLTRSDALAATSWDVDRVRCKGAPGFSVPVELLLIPEEDAGPQGAGSGTPSALPAAEGVGAAVCKPPCAPRPPGDGTAAGGDASESPPLPAEDSWLRPGLVIKNDIRTLSNPWDIFPPPCDTSSSSDASPGAEPSGSKHGPADVPESQPDGAATSASLQLPVHGWEESGDLLPYQNPPQSASPPLTAPPSAEPSAAQSDPLDKFWILDRGTEKTAEQKRRKAKRKRSELTPGELTSLVDEEEQEAGVSGSPPSWLFDTPARDGGGRQGPTGGAVTTKTSTAHSDGRPFSYFYQVSRNNLQDFSRFSVSDSLVHWAVKYLVVPKQTDNPLSTSETSNQTSSDRTEVTSL